MAVGALAEPSPVSGSRRCSPATTSRRWPAQTPAAAGPDLAHLLFTSGSTGVPKGVMIKHANVVAFVEWALRHFGTRAGDRISGHPPLHFDLSTFDIYGDPRRRRRAAPRAGGARARTRSALAAFIRDARADAVVLGALAC